VQAGRSISYQATPAGPARPTDGKTLNKPHNTAGTVMQNQPAGRTPSMTLSRYVPLSVGEQVSQRQGNEGSQHVGVAMTLEDLLGHVQVAVTPIFEDRGKSVEI